MIFEQENLIFQILDVFYVDRGQFVKTYNTNRNFDALSFRIQSDTIIETKSNQFELLSNSVCFFPAEMDYVRVSKRDNLIVVHFNTFNYQSKEIEYFYPENYEKYSELFAEILDCWERKRPAYKYEASSILNKIFSLAYKDNKAYEIKKSKIYPSVKYIKENCLKKEFSLLEASKKSLMSETYFRKLFKKEYGTSPKQYVINTRIKYAESQILSGYFSLQEIAEKSGYDDYKHFSVEFKKHTGISPSKYAYKFNTKEVQKP